jgi:PPM family protein phosphatase
MNDGEKPSTADTVEFIPSDPRSSQFYEKEPSLRVHVEVAGRSDPGKVRQNNEDNYLVVQRYRGRKVLLTSLPEEILDPSEDHAFAYAVADGMGGGKFGDLASLLAIRTGWELGPSEIKWPMKMNDREVEELRQKAETFFQLIEEAIQSEIREYPRLAGMGTTLTVCYSTGPELFVMHVGDSRAYLYRGGRLQQLTRDHNLAQVLIDSGAVQPDSLVARRMRHVLTNVLGGPAEGVSVDVLHHRLADGDRLLLCTDGLTNMVPDDDIAQVLARKPVPADACHDLVELALERGGNDNVTVVLALYKIEHEPGLEEEP